MAIPKAILKTCEFYTASGISSTRALYAEEKRFFIESRRVELPIHMNDFLDYFFEFRKIIGLFDVDISTFNKRILNVFF
jgi:hypothetical protein